jgi:hypothetical protein
MGVALNDEDVLTRLLERLGGCPYPASSLSEARHG